MFCFEQSCVELVLCCKGNWFWFVVVLLIIEFDCFFEGSECFIEVVFFVKDFVFQEFVYEGKNLCCFVELECGVGEFFDVCFDFGECCLCGFDVVGVQSCVFLGKVLYVCGNFVCGLLSDFEDFFEVFEVQQCQDLMYCVVIQVGVVVSCLQGDGILVVYVCGKEQYVQVVVWCVGEIFVVFCVLIGLLGECVCVY